MAVRKLKTQILSYLLFALVAAMFVLTFVPGVNRLTTCEGKNKPEPILWYPNRSICESVN